VSQSTISRAITAITPELARVMRPFIPAAEELPSDEQLIVDGTFGQRWSWDDHPQLYSGKHHTTGLNLQVVCDLAGRLRWISDPADGCRNDSAALRVSGVLDGVDTHNWIGDHEPEPHRQGPATLVQPLENRPQRLRHHLRRTSVRRTQVTPTRSSYTVYLTAIGDPGGSA
jgi:hypothetical protein